MALLTQSVILITFKHKTNALTALTVELLTMLLLHAYYFSDYSREIKM